MLLYADMEIVKVEGNIYRVKVKRGNVVIKVGESVEIQGGNSKTQFVIDQPGEYEVEGISVFAYQVNESLASVIQVEDLKVLTVSGILSDSLIEDQGTIDVVIVDTNTTKSKESVEMIGKIEPSCVVPSGDVANVALFIKDFEHTARETNKLSISRATLNSDITDVVVLTE